MMNSVIVKKYDMYDLIPEIENWLIKNSYTVTVIANRLDAEKGEIHIRIFMENNPSGCLIKVFSSEQVFENLKKYLAEKRLLDYLISCTYCDRKTEASKDRCGFCGATINFDL